MLPTLRQIISKAFEEHRAHSTYLGRGALPQREESALTSRIIVGVQRGVQEFMEHEGSDPEELQEAYDIIKVLAARADECVVTPEEIETARQSQVLHVENGIEGFIFTVTGE